MRASAEISRGAWVYYSQNPVDFVNHWCDTYDPRRASADTPTQIPLIMFPKQEEYVRFLAALVSYEQSGLVEKCRDMGATWVSAAFSVWLFLFRPGAAVGWGSRKEQLVDRLGDPDSIFEKMRVIIRSLPAEFLPAGFRPDEHMNYMRFVNPVNGATITGEAGDNIGRGGRKLIYFKDESAHYERPEKIEAALGDNTRIQVDISSVNGIGNVFHRRREAGHEWSVGKEPVRGRTNVFVMDWSDHPAKSQEWYDERKDKFESEGLGHVFAQEVDRKYDAAVQGTILKLEWVNAAVDADITLGLELTDRTRVAGLDIADQGLDKNAWAERLGIALEKLEEWRERDPGVSARKAVGLAEGDPIEVDYDSIGIGAAVKAEINRLKDEELLSDDVRFVSWNAAASPLHPKRHIIEDDDSSPTNEELFQNIKAQGWFMLARRFYKTWQMVNGLATHPVDELIVLRSSLSNLSTLKKELCQPVMIRSSKTMKQIVDKTPDGTTSPNLADAVMQCYWPIPNDTFEWFVG